MTTAVDSKMNALKSIIFMLAVSAVGSNNAQEPTLGDPAQFTSVTAKGAMGDSSKGPVDMVEFEASGGARAAHAIAGAFNQAKKIGISTPPDDRHKYSAEVFEIVLTSSKGEIKIFIFSQQLAMVIHGDKKQLYWFEEAFAEAGFGARFENLMFIDRDKIGLKVRELKRDFNDFGPPRKNRKK